jgi:hypothetical protein
VNAFIPIRTLYSFMPALAVAAGFRVVEERVHHRLRKSGTSKYTVGSFLVLPIIDFIGLRWFGARRCRVQPKNRLQPEVSLGEEIYRRSFARWLRTVSYTCLVSLVLLGFLVHRRESGATTHRIGLDRAERIALQRIPRGRLGVEEFLAQGNRPTWLIDVTVPNSTEIREVEIDAVDSRVVAMRTETAEEEAQETATDSHEARRKPFPSP